MSSSAPKVSVVIPVYNRERYIGETIRSVLDQTFQDFELIAVDDGCTDGSRRVLESFGERVRVLEHPGRENRGQSAAINLGLAVALGEYVAILDSDDLWMPEKLEVLVTHLDTHPDVGLVYSNGIWIDERGVSRGEMYGSQHIELSDPSRVLLDCYFALPSNSLVRREALDRAGRFDERLRTAQDHDMVVRISELTKLAYVHRVLWAYRRHTASVSKRSGELRWRNGFIILKKAVERYPYPSRVVRGRRAVLHFRLGQLAIQQRAWLRAAGHMLMAGLLDPLRAFGVIAGREAVSSPHS